MNTELNEAAEKYASDLHYPNPDFVKEQAFKAGAQWQVEQLKMPDKLKSLAIQSIFELDKNADENWRSAKQFTNGEVVKILKDFVAVHLKQAVGDGWTTTTQCSY